MYRSWFTDGCVFWFACPCHWSQQLHFLAASSTEGSYHFCKEICFLCLCTSREGILISLGKQEQETIIVIHRGLHSTLCNNSVNIITIDDIRKAWSLLEAHRAIMWEAILSGKKYSWPLSGKHFWCWQNLVWLRYGWKDILYIHSAAREVY